MESKFVIQTLNKIAHVGTDCFNENKYTITEQAQNPSGFLVRSANLHDTEFGDNLLAIARAGAGVNNIPIEKCTQKGIVVFNTPGANANAVKELVLSGLFISSRNLAEAHDWILSVANKGQEIPQLVEKGKSQFVGPEIFGKTLGVIGLGAIGCLVANDAVRLGMKVVGYDPFLNAATALKLSPKINVVTNLSDLYRVSDYITIHVPYTKDTAGMINSHTLQQMKKGVRIINYARGELVDDDAMIDALESGKVAKYMTDFPNAKILNVKNIIATPHLGASTPESEDNCAVMAAHELIDYLEYGNIRNSVNLPNAEMPGYDTRICIIHQNVPSLLAKITTTLADKGVNIENLVNKSKKEVAYSMIEVEGNVDESIVEKIEAIPEVFKVRVVHPRAY